MDSVCSARIIYFLLFYLYVLCVADDTNSKSEVVVLTDKNFDELTKSRDWLLEFYAPWCGHCKKLTPIYETVATVLKAKGIGVAKIDCTG